MIFDDGGAWEKRVLRFESAGLIEPGEEVCLAFLLKPGEQFQGLQFSRPLEALSVIEFSIVQIWVDGSKQFHLYAGPVPVEALFGTKMSLDIANSDVCLAVFNTGKVPLKVQVDLEGFSLRKNRH